MSVTKAARMNVELPSTVKAIRDGWQGTSQGGAVVSGLLAGVAAQLFNYFRDPDNYKLGRVKSPTAIGAVVALCYAAMFFNIGATISAFIIIDKLGSLTFVYARREPIMIGQFAATETAILEHYGAGSKWKYVLWHWIICFYSGTVCLAVLLLTFIWLQESYLVGVLISLVAIFSLVPTLLILIFERSPGASADSEEDEGMESGNPPFPAIPGSPQPYCPIGNPHSPRSSMMANI